MLIILVFLSIGTAILSLPSVQTSLAKRITEKLNTDFKTKIKIQQVTASLFTWNTTLRGVYVEDYEKDTLFYVNKLTTSLLSAKKAVDGDLEFGNIHIDGLLFKMITYKGNRDTNLDVFVARFDEENPTVKSSKPFFMSASGMELKNGRFKYIDENLSNIHVLDLNDLEGEINDFQVLGPEVDIGIKRLSFQDHRGLRIKQLATDFKYTKSYMDFKDLKIVSNKSFLDGSLRFDYDRADFAEFLDKVKLRAKFKNSTISLEDVNIFYYGFNEKLIAEFNADVSGTLNQLQFDYLDLNCNNSTIRGDFNFNNLFEDNGFRMFGGIENITTDYYDLIRIMPPLLQENLPEYVKKLEQFTLRGEVEVTDEDLSLNINMFSDIGSIKSTLKLDKVADINNIAYQGYTSLIDFDLGKFLEEDKLGSISLDFNVDGTSFVAENMNVEVNGNVFQMDFLDYNYGNIQVSGLFKDQLFDGNFELNDPNIKLTFEGLADLSLEKNKLDFKAKIDYADLYRLQLTKDSTSILKGTVKLDVIGNSIDDFTGDINVSKTSYTNIKTAYYFNDFRIRSTFNKKSNERELRVNSPDIITGKMTGKFRLAELPNLTKNALGSIYANYEPYPVTAGQHVYFDFKIYNKIVEAFYPDITLGRKTAISGRLNADKGDFKLDFISPNISAFGNIFKKVNFQLDNKNPLYNTFLEVEEVRSTYYEISNFSLINTKLNDTLYFRSEFKGGKQKEDSYNLNLYQTFDKNNRSVIGFKKSDLTFKGNTWYINEKEDSSNKIEFTSNLESIHLQQFVLSHLDEKISLQGKTEGKTKKDFKLELNNISLDKVLPEIDSLKLAGTLNGSFNLFQNGKNYLPSTNMKISNLKVNKFDYGDLFFAVIGNEDMSNFAVNGQLMRKGVEAMNVIGNVINKNGEQNASLFASLQEFDISPFSPLGEDVITNIRGLVSGGATITGPLNDLKFNGTLTLNEAGFKIPYTNVNYNLGAFSRVDLQNNTFNISDVTVFEDKHNTTARLFGAVSHKNFEDWRLNLNVDTRNNKFLVLDTDFEEGEERPLYGLGFINGTGEIYGPINAITLRVDATSADGTFIKIPISDVASIGDYSFINFYDKNRAVNIETEDEAGSSSGLRMEFDLNILENAEVEIVVDQENNSTIKGRAAGLLLIEITPATDISMYGDIAVMSGSYNFRYGGLIDKTLSVKSGGTITWEGDPYDAIIDLEAVYKLNANPAPILDNTDFTRRIPVETILSLDGTLKSPDIAFDIEFPGAHSVLRSELDYRLQDKDKKEQQAFSLLSQGIFVSELSITQEAITGNLIQTASGIINQALSNKDDTFNLGLSYEQGYRDRNSDFRTDDRVGFTVSTKLDENVLINGRVGVPVGGVTETVLIGEIEVQVFLNKEKTLSMKVFNRENEIQQFLTEQAGYTQGIGLSYQVDFNTFQGLIKKIFGKKHQEILQPSKKDSTQYDTGKKDFIKVHGLSNRN